MKSLELKSFYAQSLGISTAWKVADGSFGGDHLVVAMFVECAVSVARADPGSGLRAYRKDCQERTWHRLASCQFGITRAARILHLPTTNGPSLSASVLLTQRMVGLVATSQSHPLDAMSNSSSNVRGASSQSGIGTKQFAGRIGRDVRHGRSRYAMSFSKWLQRGLLAS